MADILPWGQGGKGIQAYEPQDAYYIDIDNRPLFNLANNDYKLNSELQSLVPKRFLEIPDGIINIFTFMAGEMAIPGSLMVYLNGLPYNPQNIFLMNNNTQFEIINGDVIPDLDDDFYAIYRIGNSILQQEDFIAYNELANTYIGNFSKAPILRNSLRIYFDGIPMLQDDGQGSIRIIGNTNALTNFVGTVDYINRTYDFLFNFENGISGDLDSGYESGGEDVVEAIYQYYVI